MFKKIYYCIGIILLFCACNDDVHLDKIEGKRISISDSLPGNAQIENFIKPFRERVNKDLDSVLAYAVETYDKRDGDLNTAIGNFMADAVYEQANPIFESRTGRSIDIVLLNYGGIRAPIPKGPISTRTAYEVMPFENSVVVTELKGEQIQALVTFLAKQRRANPFSGMKLTLDNEGKIMSATINGEPIENNKVYAVATSDYLFNGGDNMAFLKENEELTLLDYKIRNALIDYFKKIDTLQPTIDDRFIQLKN